MPSLLVEDSALPGSAIDNIDYVVYIIYGSAAIAEKSTLLLVLCGNESNFSSRDLVLVRLGTRLPETV